MAVPQNRKTSSKRDMRRSHDALTGPTLSVERQSGEVHPPRREVSCPNA